MAIERVGWIGLGIMGRPMSHNLQRAGFHVIGFSRTPQRLEPLVAAGGEAATSPADVARRSEVVITMVPDTPDVEQVLFGEHGVVQGVRPGTIVIDMSTISPAATRCFAQRLAVHGVEMLDAPVSGGETGARQGTLSIMVGGKEPVFEQCRPIFAALGRKITYVGLHGSGQVTKLCNQVAGVLTLQSVCEALLLAKASGVDVHRVMEALTAGSGDSWNLRHQGPKMLERDFQPGFYVRLQRKDLRLACELGTSVGVPLPGTALVDQLFAAVEALGGSESGVQALILALEALAGRRFNAHRD